MAAELDTLIGNWDQGKVLIDAGTDNFRGSSLQVYMNGKLEIDAFIRFPCMVSGIFNVSVREKPQSIDVVLDGKRYSIDMDTIR